jgi:hypothetical protein
MPGATLWETEFQVNLNAENDQDQPVVTGLAEGRFVVTWRDQSATLGDASSTAIHAQIFNADGSRAGAEFLVNTATNASQEDPAITALADGKFVVSWSDFSQVGGDNDNWAVQAQVFNVDGSKSGSQFLVNTSTTGGQVDPAIAALADGRFVVTWEDGSDSRRPDRGDSRRACRRRFRRRLGGQ